MCIHPICIYAPSSNLKNFEHQTFCLSFLLIEKMAFINKKTLKDLNVIVRNRTAENVLRWSLSSETKLS